MAARAWAEAESLLLSCLELAEDEGGTCLRLTSTLENLVEVFWYQGKFSLAAPLLRRLLRIYTEDFGADHYHIGIVANNAAMLYHAWGKFAEAEHFYLRAFEIKRRVLGDCHPEVSGILGNYIGLLRVLKRDEEARKLDTYVRSLKESALQGVAARQAIRGMTGSVGSSNAPGIMPF